MILFAIRRLFTTLPTLLIVTVLVFALVHLLPGDPARIMLGEGATPEAVIALREKLGFDRSIPEQYFRWMGNVVQLDLGSSTRNIPVTTLIAEKLPITLELALLATLLSVVIAVPAGLISALKPGGYVDRTMTLLALCGISLPTFFAGILLIYLFSIHLAWVPAGGYVSFFVKSRQEPDVDDPSEYYPGGVLGSGAQPLYALQHARSHVAGLHPHGLSKRCPVLDHCGQARPA